MSHSGFWSAWRLSSPTEWERIQTELFANVDLVQTWMRGSLTAEDIVERLIGRSQATFDIWMAELVRSCRQMELTDSSVPTLLRRIRRTGVKVAIATDNMDTFMRWTVPALGLVEMVDDILDSWSLRSLKNDREANGRSPFFHPWLERHGMDPNEAVLFDDGGSCSQEIGIRWVPVTNVAPLASCLQNLLVTLS